MPAAIIRGQTINWVVEHYPGFWTKAAHGDWEPHTYATLERLLSPDATVLDLGAHVGAITLFAAHHAARVIAVEPDPISRHALTQNLAVNPDLASRVVVIPKAASGTTGSLLLRARGAGGDSMSSSLLPEALTEWRVDTITPTELASLLPDDGPVFVKVDIEGGEYALVPAAAVLWYRPQTTLLLSTHPEILRRSGTHVSVRQHTAMMFRALNSYRCLAVGPGAGSWIARLAEGAARGWGIGAIQPRDWLFVRDR